MAEYTSLASNDGVISVSRIGGSGGYDGVAGIDVDGRTDGGD